MTFERTWILLFLAAPLAWLYLEWPRTSRRGGLLLKALALVATILALSEPKLNIAETRLAVAVLVDTSQSISDKDLKDATEIASRIQKAAGRHWTRVIPFARETRPMTPDERAQLLRTSGEPARATDLEAAIREGLAALPEGLIPKLVLISDGKENQGSVARASWQASLAGVPVDTYALAGRPQPALRLDSVSVPSLAFTGERFPVDLTVQSPVQTQATVELAAEGKPLGSSEVTIEEGTSHIRVHTSISVAGVVDLAGTIRTPSHGTLHFEQAVHLRRPRALFVSADPAGTEKHLLQTLEAAQFEIVQSSEGVPSSFDDYQLVILNNWDFDSIPVDRQTKLEEFVKLGGGLIVIGGERNRYDENRKAEGPLERALPAKIAPPQTPEGTCVVLIVDKSSSMEGRKMELARQASIGVIEHLRPVDMVGVLIFDNSFQWTVPIRRAEDKTLIKRLVAGIVADGGTQIAPALSEAYRRILPVRAVYKHIVLLTDGISEEGDSIALSKEAAQHRVTISTVGLGQDVNRAYLEKIASNSLGKSYFLTDPSGLEQILIKDVKEHSGSTAIEKFIRPAIARNSKLLEGVGIDNAPPLRGYVKFDVKPTAETILTLERDPLLTRWQYGLGRAAVFTSDAKSRWAQDWVSWSGFDRFWANVMRDLLPHAHSGEATAEFDSANGDLIVDYRLARHLEEPKTIPDIYVFGPNGFRRPIEVRKVASGAFRGRVQLGHRTGLFRVRPLEDSRVFPEVGYYRQEAELYDYGSNELLLKKVSEFTGGRHQPEPAEVFDTGGRSITSTMRLWPALLALAIALNIAELVLRKWKGVLGAFRRS
jgi:Uncharacterized protein containing a von Willebrand factor type A (vWA) domain